MITAGPRLGGARGRLNIGVVGRGRSPRGLDARFGWLGTRSGLRGRAAHLPRPSGPTAGTVRRKAASPRAMRPSAVTPFTAVGDAARLRVRDLSGAGWSCFVLGAPGFPGSFFIGPCRKGCHTSFGEEVAKRIGDAGAKAVLGVLRGRRRGGWASGPGGPGGAPRRETPGRRGRRAWRTCFGCRTAGGRTGENASRLGSFSH